jgi:DNA-binding MarR family transcriptional regulator
VKSLHNDVRSQSAATGVALERLFGLAVQLGETMAHGLAERRLTRPRATVIWLLYHQGPVTQRELSQALHVTPRNVTGLVDALQEAGLVARGRHPTDRRATLVELTGEGVATAAALRADYERLAERLFGDIRAAEVTRFVHTLDLVLERLRTFEGT